MQMHLKPTLLLTIQLLNDFDQLFLIKFIPRIISSGSSFIVSVGGFLEEIATITKTSFVNCGL